MINKRLISFSIIILILLFSVGFAFAEENATQTPIAEENNTLDESLIEDPTPLSISNETDSYETAVEVDDVKVGTDASDVSNGNHDSNISFFIPDEIVVGTSFYVEYESLTSFKGDIDIYIDGEYSDILDIRMASTGWQRVNSPSLKLGNHTCNLVYNGSDYYKPFNETYKFEVVTVIIELRELMYDNEDIKVLVPNDDTGTVTITVDGKSKKFTIDEGQVRYYVYNIAYGKHDIAVTYTGNYGNLTKRENVTVEYYLYLYEYSDNNWMYLDDEEIGIYFDYYNYGNMTLSIDGKAVKYDKYNVDIPDDEPAFLFLPAPIHLAEYDLSKGNHTFEITYSGDDKRPAKSVKQTFYIKESKLNLDAHSQLIVNKNYPINFLINGNNTEGNFSLYYSADGVNYTLVECVTITNDTATTSITFPKVGKNYLKVIYNTTNGNDEFYREYDVTPVQVTNWELHTNPYYERYWREIYLNSDKIDTVFLEYGENVVGNVSIYINKYNGDRIFYKQVEIPEGGKMNITIPQSAYSNQVGRYKIELVWNTTYGSGNDFSHCFLDVIDISALIPVNDKALSTLYCKKAIYSITVYKEDGTHCGKNEIITFQIGKLTYQSKTDENGVATLITPKTLKPGTYTITATYKNLTCKKTLVVKHILSVKKFKVKKSANKLVLTAMLYKKLKNKKVVFKFYGKRYVARTNKYGVAQITIKKSVLNKLKVGKKVAFQVSYLQDTIKGTAKIYR